jgi:hypothetical protein
LSGWKDWQIGEVVEAAEFQTFLQDQVVQVYADSSARGSALGTAVAEGMASYVKDTDSFEVYDGTGWVPVSVDAAWVTAGTAGEILRSNGTADPSWVEAETTLTAGTSGFTALSAGTAGISYQPVSHNYIINGDFSVNQRSFTSLTADGAYGFDRFRHGAADGTSTFTAEAFTPGSAPVAGYEAANFLRIQTTGQTLAGAVTNVQQRVEDVRTLAGQTATISFWAKAASGTPSIAVEIEQNFGSGGSPSASVQTLAAKNQITTSWQRYSATVTVPSIAGKTIGTNANTSHVRIIFWVSAGSNFNARLDSLGIQSNTFDIWGVQLEAGSVATPFKRHEPSLQGELAACQRYYYRQSATTITTNYGLGFPASTTIGVIQIKHPVTMRISPTSVESSNLLLSDASANYTVSAATLGDSNPHLTALNVTTSGMTIHRPLQLRANVTTSSFLGFSAEL